MNSDRDDRHRGGPFRRNDGQGDGYGRGPRREGGPRGDKPAGPGGFRPSRPFAKQANPGEGIRLDDELKEVLHLKTEKGREKSGRYLVEGVRAVCTMLERVPENVLQVYEIPGVEWDRSLVRRGRVRVPVREISAGEMDLLSVTKTAQGLLAVAEARAARVNYDTARRITLVDAIQDPGNLGAIFRSSAAFGFDAVVLGKGTVDAWNPRTVRGSSGIVAGFPFEQDIRLDQHLSFLRSKGFTIVGTSPYGKDRLDTLPPGAKIAILVGNEARGAAAHILDLCDLRVRIPIASGVESLNVAVAHGILCSQLVASA